ncbi:Y-family DNA polymerase [Pseudochrobactrum sp. MP213Fo]|uniref:Y-family DNA polymerase n=1 Tax=Pseudochrobactrum sp. MP213Fo TaxID=3022250 RepID=UPI003BA0A872
MRKPETIERLYLDFDGFFASVEQQCDRSLRGRPVGVVPFAGTDRTAVIACSKEAKAFGVKNVMKIKDAKALCPDIILVPQKPDLYRRAHNALLSEIESVIAIDTAKSIDELTCILDDTGRNHPESLAQTIKQTIHQNIGPYITCSIGFAANRQLAKMACKAGKDATKKTANYGNGLAIWHPHMMPKPFFDVKLSDVPGIGDSMRMRLAHCFITTTEQLYNIQPKHMRKIWKSVNGERLWYALHGYDIQAQPQKRGMYGHTRVLPPEARSITGAYEIARLLLVKAGRRLRRDEFYAGGLWLYLSLKDGSWFHNLALPSVNDEQAILTVHRQLWALAKRQLPRNVIIYNVGVTLHSLSEANARQLDIFNNDDVIRQKWEKANGAMDSLNAKYSSTIVHMGEYKPPTGGHVGGKISYVRIPSAEDFY